MTDPKPEAISFDDVGFLSPSVGVWAADVRAEQREHFELADRLNRLGMRVLMSIGLGHDNAVAADYAARAYGRALESFQAALLLSQIGALAEARALARMCVEAAIAIGALKTDPEDAVERLHEDHDRGRRALAHAFLQGSDGERPSAEAAA